ncbi:hypothetical protein LCGC14_2011300 [marine sediment metagenome]|uniref:Uncharacterized protein n=1 Tax=marine sediment metagenome TaxID=412755 RepID=A0A0F9HXJ0_9ZZZZ
MCYICEARGTVGPNYKAAQKEIAAARRAWGKQRRIRDDGLRNFLPSWGDGKDWTKPAPASKRLWTLAELKEYGEAWRREHSNS